MKPNEMIRLLLENRDYTYRQISQFTGASLGAINKWKTKPDVRINPKFKEAIKKLFYEKYGVPKHEIVIKDQTIDISNLPPEAIERIVQTIEIEKNRYKGAGPRQKESIIVKTPRKKKILVIDDEIETCEQLKSFLSERGYDVYVAFSGLDGLEKYKELKPDLILLDLKIPDIEGKEVLEIIRQYDKDLPIMVITSYPADVADIHKDNLFITGYFEKPLHLYDLVSRINETLGLSG